MASQTPASSSNSLWLLEALTFFEDNSNTKKKWQGVWSFNDIDSFARTIARNIDPTSNQKNFSEIVSLLRNFFQDEEAIASQLPNNLQQILKEYEEQQKEAAFLKERVKAKALAVQEVQERHSRNIALIERLSQTAVRKLSQTPLSARETEYLAQTLAENLEIDRQLVLNAEKIEKIPNEEDKVTATTELDLDWQEDWEETIDKTAEQARRQEKSLSQEQIDYLKQNRPETRKLLEAVAKEKSALQQRELVEEIKIAITPPLDQPTAQKLADNIVPEVVANLPETDVDWSKFDQLPETKQRQIITQLNQEIQETTVMVLAQEAPTIIKEIEIPPTKISKIIGSFVPRTQEEFETIVSTIQTTQENRRVNLELPIIPAIAATLPDKGPYFIGSDQNKAMSAPIEKIVTGEQPKIPVVREFSNILKTNGLNHQTSSFFSGRTSEHSMFLLASSGVTPKNIRDTADELRAMGVSEGSLAIRELEKTERDLNNYLLTTKMPKEEIERLQRQRKIDAEKGRTKPITLPGSRSHVQIIDATKTKFKSGSTSRLDQFFRRSKLFGEKSFLFQNRLIFVNKISNFFQNTALNVKTWFFKTGFGKTIKSGLQKIGHQALQVFWNSAKTGVKKAAGKVTISLGKQIAVKGISQLAATAIAPGIGNIITAIVQFAPTVIKTIGNFFKSFISTLTGGVVDKKDINLLTYTTVFGAIALPLIILLIGVSPIISTFLMGGSIIPGEKKEFIVTKVVSPSQFKNPPEQNPPYELNYSITISAVAKKLTNISLTEETTLFQDGKQTKLTPPSKPGISSSLEAGETQTINYKMKITQKLKDAIILNSVLVSANIEGITETNEVRASATVIIGNATGCFTLAGPWSTQDQTLEISAISKVLSSSKYSAGLCTETIVLKRVLEDNWCWVERPNIINITNRCLGNEEFALYGLAHESGHIYAIRNNSTYSNFVRSVSGGKESFLCSYPEDKTPDEDFPETIAVYLTNQFYPRHKYGPCGGTEIDLKTQYPIHYDFIKDLF